jgi:hypothetical protein
MFTKLYQSILNRGLESTTAANKSSDAKRLKDQRKHSPFQFDRRPAGKRPTQTGKVIRRGILQCDDNVLLAEMHGVEKRNIVQERKGGDEVTPKQKAATTAFPFAGGSSATALTVTTVVATKIVGFGVTSQHDVDYQYGQNETKDDVNSPIELG